MACNETLLGTFSNSPLNDGVKSIALLPDGTMLLGSAAALGIFRSGIPFNLTIWSNSFLNLGAIYYWNDKIYVLAINHQVPYGWTLFEVTIDASYRYPEQLCCRPFN